MTEPDTPRFERLYRENFERVAAYLLSRAERGLAEDALARTFEIAWRRLPDVPRDPLPCLLLVAWDGLSQREAAAALGCSRGAVALRLHRARARIGAAAAEEVPSSVSPVPPIPPVLEEAR